MSTCSGRKYPLKVYLLYYYEKIFGLCPISFKNNEDNVQISQRGMWYSIIICIVYSILFYKNIIIRFNRVYSMESYISAVWDRSLQIFQYITVIVSWINFGFRQKELKSIVVNFKKIGEIAENLEIPNNKLEIIKLITINVVLVNVLCLIQWNVELYINSLSDSDTLIRVIWGINSVFRIVYHNVLFLFVSNLHIIYRHFRQLNVRLKYFIIHRDNSHESLIRISNSEITITIEAIGTLHSELLDLLEDVTNFFYLPILTALITSFLQMVACINLMYLFLRKSREWYIADIIIIGYVLMWTFILTLEFFLISSVSGNLNETAKNSGNILHKMWIIQKPIGCRRIIKKVSLMLLQRRATITLYGFLSLDYNFLYGIIGVITTYLVIILQLD